MRRIFLLLLMLASATYSYSQQTELKYYDPLADALKEVNKAVLKANSNQKNVLLQIGGNWCKWCRLYDKWSHSTPLIDSLINANFEVVHVNFSPENKNPELMKQLGFPQRFGFPVIVILDSKGNRIHTQNTGYLEEGEGYSEKKVAEFLRNWSTTALDGKSYE
ncbi:MAG: thioredoxin family protein [Bacteroidetes bacterium]|nr:thioredoxin family protein [Bacteroidota bacterium]